MIARTFSGGQRVSPGGVSPAGAASQGSILYFDGTGAWAILGPGTSGNVLKTFGASANPAWGTLTAADVGADASGAAATAQAAAQTYTDTQVALRAALTGAAFTGSCSITVTDSGTVSVTTLATFQHATSGTPAAGFGGQALWRAHNAANTMRDQGALNWDWTTATAGSEASRFQVLLRTGGAALASVFTLYGSGGGFFGPATPADPGAGFLAFANTKGLAWQNSVGTMQNCIYLDGSNVLNLASPSGYIQLFPNSLGNVAIWFGGSPKVTITTNQFQRAGIGWQRSRRTIGNANATIAVTDDIVAFNTALTANRDANLPTGVGAGSFYTICMEDAALATAFVVNVKPPAGKKLFYNGVNVASVALSSTSPQSVDCYSDGSDNYYITGAA